MSPDGTARVLCSTQEAGRLRAVVTTGRASGREFQRQQQRAAVVTHGRRIAVTLTKDGGSQSFDTRWGGAATRLTNTDGSTRAQLSPDGSGSLQVDAAAASRSIAAVVRGAGAAATLEGITTLSQRPVPTARASFIQRQARASRRSEDLESKGSCSPKAASKTSHDLAPRAHDPLRSTRGAGYISRVSATAA